MLKFKKKRSGQDSEQNDQGQQSEDAENDEQMLQGTQAVDHNSEDESQTV